MPHKRPGAPKLELEPESSAAPGDDSGEELAGAVPGAVLLDGIVVTGASAGVAELVGTPAEASGGEEEADGPFATVGAATGLLTGDTAGVSAVGGGVAGDGTGGGEDTLLDGLEAGETEDGG